MEVAFEPNPKDATSPYRKHPKRRG